ncbi:MAG: LysR family transcriptional regulator [Sneathiella sp.]
MKPNKEALDGMAVFVQVVESGGFTAAARRLGNSTSFISKEITRLESRLGVRLLNRTTRTISLTDIGTTYFGRCRQIIEDAEDAERNILQLHERPQGHLKVSAPISLNHSSLKLILPGFLKRYPDIQLDIELNDRIVDVIGEGFDVAIRGGNLIDSNLVKRRIMTSEAVIVASPTYLEMNGTPKHPSELAHHDYISYSYRKTPDILEFTDENGKQMSIKLSPRILCNNAELEEAFAIQGLGISGLPLFACQQALIDGRLIRILENFVHRPIQIHALYPHRQHLSAKVRVFIDYLVKYLACPSEEQFSQTQD